MFNDIIDKRGYTMKTFKKLTGCALLFTGLASLVGCGKSLHELDLAEHGNKNVTDAVINMHMTEEQKADLEQYEEESGLNVKIIHVLSGKSSHKYLVQQSVGNVENCLRAIQILRQFSSASYDYGNYFACQDGAKVVAEGRVYQGKRFASVTFAQ